MSEQKPKILKPNGSAFKVRTATGESSFFYIKGRERWALENLIRAGKHGCTPIDHPGPRWSAYVHSLRHEFHLHIETIHEKHEGPFPGTHARYVLHSLVEVAR